MKIKLCGLSRPEDIEAANQCKPDYIGFVFAPSRRQVTMEQACSLKSHLDPAIASVGVFVNADQDEIIKIARSRCIDLIQLHGDETFDQIQTIKKETALPIIKAIRVRNQQSPLPHIPLDTVPYDYLLLDTYIPGQYGGSGQTFDWSLIPEMRKPYFLAGGITFSNIHDALSTSAYSIDVSSAIETNGAKDAKKMRQMVDLIRNKI